MHIVLAVWAWIKSILVWAFSRETIFTVVCWIAAAYFAYASLQPFFPPPSLTENGRYVPLLFAVVFLLAPFAKKVEIAKVLTFESRLKEVKKEQEKQEQEIRHLQTLQANLANSVTTLSAVSNSAQVNNYFHPPVTSEEAKQDIVEAADTELVKSFTEVLSKEPARGARNREEHDLWMPDPDALKGKLLVTSAHLQERIRQILGRELVVSKRNSINYMSARRLYNHLLKRYPELLPLEKSFEFFVSVANAVSHGAQIDMDNVQDAIVFGDVLEKEIDRLEGKLDEEHSH